MATGRIGVTPTLGVRWSKAPAGGTTSLSGLDDNSVSLVYSVGYEQVYRNGVLLSRTNDYTATNGTTITLVDATIAGDIIEVFANELVPLTDAISKGQFNAKGALLSATAASTPGVLAVGSNNQVLTADSTTSTGLKWATPSGGLTLINRSTFSSVASHIVDNVFTSSYKSYLVVVEQIYSSTANDIEFQFRYGGSSGTTDTAATHYYHTIIGLFNSTSLAASLAGNGTTSIKLGGNVGTSTYPFSSNINVSNVGNASENPSINYIGHNAGGSPGVNVGAGTLFSSRTFTGFLLKSSTNVTGAVSVYGYGI